MSGPEVESLLGKDFPPPSRPVTRSFLTAKRPERGVNHSLPSTDKVKKKSTAIPVLTVCAFMAGYRVNLYLYLKNQQ
jgi:hypothetical protein